LLIIVALALLVGASRFYQASAPAATVAMPSLNANNAPARDSLNYSPSQIVPNANAGPSLGLAPGGTSAQPNNAYPQASGNRNIPVQAQGAPAQVPQVAAASGAVVDNNTMAAATPDAITLGQQPTGVTSVTPMATPPTTDGEPP